MLLPISIAFAREIGWREEKYEEYESWFEDITGNPPDKTQELDMLRLVGDVEPTESEIIRLLGLLDDYDVAEVGAYEILTSILEEANETFWNIQQPGEYSNVVLQIWTRQDLLEQLGSWERSFEGAHQLAEESIVNNMLPQTIWDGVYGDYEGFHHLVKPMLEDLNKYGIDFETWAHQCLEPRTILRMPLTI